MVGDDSFDFFLFTGVHPSSLLVWSPVSVSLVVLAAIVTLSVALVVVVLVVVVVVVVVVVAIVMDGVENVLF